VIPVAPFGRGLQQNAWRAFRQRTGVAVVIDGAASFEAFERDPQAGLGEVPVAFSFHATKSFACGEGGAVASTDLALVRDVMRALNFGFLNSRDSCSASINGKLS